MPNVDIKISQLNPLPVALSGKDFFPIDQSSSLTTFRTDINSLNTWFAASGSASYAPAKSVYWSASANNSNNISNTNTGYVGINQNNPTYRLDVNGTSRFSDVMMITRSVAAGTPLFIMELTGSGQNGSIQLGHANVGGYSSILFRGDGMGTISNEDGDHSPSPFNTAWWNTDYGVIKYTDLFTDYGYLTGGQTSSALVIAVGDDPEQDKIVLKCDTIILDASLEAGRSNGVVGMVSIISGSLSIGNTPRSQNTNTLQVSGNVNSISNTSSFYTGITYSSSVNNGVGFYGTASYANNSTSASYAPPTPNFIKALGTFYATGSLGTHPGDAAFIPFSGSYNFISASYQGYTYQPATDYGGGLGGSMIAPTRITSVKEYGQAHTWIFYMNNPLPSTNYTIITTIGGEQAQESSAWVNFPFSSRTTTAFSMSYVAGWGGTLWDSRAPDSPSEQDWLSLMVLHM